jgi:hypothetical protein
MAGMMTENTAYKIQKILFQHLRLAHWTINKKCEPTVLETL